MNKWPFFSKECRKEVDAILRSSILTAYKANGSCLGPAKDSQAWRLEREIEKKFGVRHAVAVNSGTAGLHAALEAVGVRGREVITTAYTFSATGAAILLAGGIPRFADVDGNTFCITKESVKGVVTKKTGAILHVNLFGYLPDLSGLAGYGVPVVEDACQSVGAHRGGRYAGAHGIAGAYSFNGGKNIPSGEGGCVVTNDGKIAEKARLLMNHGENFGSVDVGYNYRMTEMTACVARHGLMELESRNQRRRELAWTFDATLCGMSEIVPPVCMGHVGPIGKDHVFYVTPFLYKPYDLKVPSRKEFIRRCARRGLPIQAGYTTPLHRLPAFRKYQTVPLPVTERLHEKELCLLTTLTPDRPLSYARKVARIIRESLS